MTLERLRKTCLAFPGATEQIQWGADLVFKVGGKMFCVACTEAGVPATRSGRGGVVVAPVVTSFKCEDETFAELCEREGIIPAPYMARAKWVALERWDALEDREFRPLLERAYALVKEKLPKKAQAALDGAAVAPARAGRGSTKGKAARAARR